MIARGSVQLSPRGQWLRGYLTDGAGCEAAGLPCIFLAGCYSLIRPEDVHAIRVPVWELGLAPPLVAEVIALAIRAGYPIREPRANGVGDWPEERGRDGGE